MKITALETVQVGEYDNVVWVRLHTDQGLIGLGETFRNPAATVAYLHETCAPWLVGKDPRLPEAHSFALMNRVGNAFKGFPTRSVEVRGNSAVDIALWDLLGQSLGAPLHQVLGGKVRERIRVYNTCAGYSYNTRARTDANTEQASRDGRAADAARPYDDLEAQMHRPAELAESLLAEGIAAMKVWPFDPAALASEGRHIDRADLKAGVAIIEAIRKAVGDRMDILLEFHSLWHLQPALEIAAALADLGIYWFEDPIGLHNIDDLARYRDRARARVAASENLGTLAWYRAALPAQAIDVATSDMAWTGGLTAARKIAALTEAFDRTFAPHDCTGPVVLCANSHLLMAAPNAQIGETVRAFVRGFYRDALTHLPRIEAGFMHPLDGPGLGTALSPDLLKRPDARVRRTPA